MPAPHCRNGSCRYVRAIQEVRFHNGLIRCAKLLLDAYACIDPKDRNKSTPLHLAAENGHSQMLELLLAYGADVTIQDSLSRNALERAIVSGQK